MKRLYNDDALEERGECLNSRVGEAAVKVAFSMCNPTPPCQCTYSTQY
jgi:hypothetical protein